MSFLQRLRASLGKAREAFSAVQRLGRPSEPLTDAFWDELEETLILADFGVPTTQKI
ncbi:MAG: signal recognition particle receptor subunit alpha, partial [Candidatus Eremiobacteraeota bacterium]|nr:signal recognition particle receptor subunit alpha [Candidatus Eremiobacteraeota bacterium]